MRISDWSSDVCSSDLGARIGRQGERQIVVGAAGVRTDEGLAGLKVRPSGLQIAGDLGERCFRVAELEVDLIARKEQRCTDRHVVAKKGLDGEGIEAALQLAATI